jgi:predicted nucleic acid-binding protein
LAELICDTSVIQYLHQLNILTITRDLSDRVIIPPAVEEELQEGREAGIDLPVVKKTDWIEIECPAGEKDVPLVTDLGPGETEVLMLALESRTKIAVLDDKVARKAADMLELQFTGTLGLLVDAKTRGLLEEVRPLLDKLENLNFHIGVSARQAVLRAAGED